MLLTPQTRIVLAAHPTEPVRRAGAYLHTEVARRTGWRWEVCPGAMPRVGDIVLGLRDDALPVPAGWAPRAGEEIVLYADAASQGMAWALAGAPSVALAAAGALARAMTLRPGSATLGALSLRHHASFPVRGHTFANHKQTNTYDKWAWADWEECLTGRAAWGDNTAILYPLHPGRSFGCLPFGDLPIDAMPWFDSPLRQAEFERQLEIQLRLPALCHALGMRYGLWIPVNDVYPEQVRRRPALTRHGGPYVCPHIPAARAALRALRERILRLIPALDILFLPSKDDGGCPGCADCHPWVETYLELAQEQAAQAQAHHPACRVWLAQQGLGASEASALLRWLDRERPDWVEGVAFGPFSEQMTFADGQAEGASGLSLERYGRSGAHSGPVQRLRAALPGEYRLVLYPDEAHTLNCQYPVLGMDAIVQYVWGREDGPAPRPAEMALHAEQTLPASDGATPYSEGDTDDVNKAVWSARAWDFARSAEAIAAEYAGWHFGAAGPLAAELIALQERCLNAPLWDNVEVGRAVDMVRAAETLDGALLENWRWLNLRIGALMLAYLQQVQRRDRELAAGLRYRIAAWRSLPDPLPGLTETAGYLERRLQESDGLLREIAWTRERLFALHKLAIRGVARLQASYAGFDRILARWRELLPRLAAGELADFPARYAALLEEPLRAERGAFTQMEGLPLLPHLQEFAWESGRTVWDRP